MINIGWQDNKYRSHLHFADLLPNEAFSIDTCASKGAVYIKVYRRHRDSSMEYKMLELATGEIFAATASLVKKVKVDVKIHTNKPDLYS